MSKQSLPKMSLQKALRLLSRLPLTLLKLLTASIDDLLYLLGGGLLTYGIWLTFRPAGYMAGGLILMSLGLLVAKRRAHDERGQARGR